MNPKASIEEIATPMGGASSDATQKGGASMQELMVDFITSLDGYGAAEP